jgi:DNA-binding transcriptional MerR regulator
VRIGELAEATGTTPRVLRHYEQAGLISAERAPNGYRSYDEHAAVRVRNVRCLLAVGLTLDDVRAFLPCLDGDVAAAPPSGKGLPVAFNTRPRGIRTRDRLETVVAAGRSGDSGGRFHSPNAVGH